MKNLSNWRSVRVWELGVERDLRERHALWLHGAMIGFIVMGLMWLTSFAQYSLLESDSLAVRYVLTMGVAYLGYLILLRIWAASLLRNETSAADLSIDIPGPGGSPAAPASPGGGINPLPRISSGGGGDFGGGGASGDFTGADVALSGDASHALSDVGEVAGEAIGAAAGADEGAVVIVPVVVIFLMGLAAVFGAGSLLLLYFGSDVLLAIAVELAFAYVSSRTAISVAREGWLSAAVRLTWKPLLGAVVCAVALGVLIDVFIPSAHSLPEAVRVLQAQR